MVQRLKQQVPILEAHGLDLTLQTGIACRLT